MRFRCRMFGHRWLEVGRYDQFKRWYGSTAQMETRIVYRCGHCGDPGFSC